MEQWKALKDFEEIYQISDWGRIRNIQTGIIRKPTRNNSGYLCVTLKHKGKIKTCTIHRLVATHFIPNPFNLSDVNHIDENKSNNNASNLEWISHYDNCNYGNRNKKLKQKSIDYANKLKSKGHSTARAKKLDV